MSITAGNILHRILKRLERFNGLNEFYSELLNCPIFISYTGS